MSSKSRACRTHVSRRNYLHTTRSIKSRGGLNCKSFILCYQLDQSKAFYFRLSIVVNTYLLRLSPLFR